MIANVPFRITSANELSWKGHPGFQSRGRIVDKRGQFFPNGEPLMFESVSERSAFFDAQISSDMKREARRMQEQHRALTRGGKIRHGGVR